MPFWMNFNFEYNSSLFVHTTPITTSECPLMYFVTEWTTKSAPSERGDWKYGEQNVLSTANKHPLACATFDVLEISEIWV